MPSVTAETGVDFIEEFRLLCRPIPPVLLLDSAAVGNS
jgi:hypothetical protein